MSVVFCAKWCALDWFYMWLLSVVRSLEGFIKLSSPYYYFFFLGGCAVVSVNIAYLDKISDFGWLLLCYVAPAASFYLLYYFSSPVSLMTHFVPNGAPVLLSGFICLLETLSLLLRPFVMYLRISVNVLGGGLLFWLSVSGSNYWTEAQTWSAQLHNCLDSFFIVLSALTGLTLFWFYECFVAVLQTFIVKILHDLEVSMADSL